MGRIGQIGGMSWESTRSYYTSLNGLNGLNELTAQRFGPWHQPRALIDSLGLSEIVGLQRRDG